MREKGWPSFEVPDEDKVRDGLRETYGYEKLDAAYRAADHARDVADTKVRRAMEAYRARCKAELKKRFDRAELDLASATTTAAARKVIESLP